MLVINFITLSATNVLRSKNIKAYRDLIAMTLTQKLVQAPTSLVTAPDTYDYKLAFAKKFLKNLFTRHKPKLLPEHLDVSSTIEISPALLQNWHEFLGLQSSLQASAPYFLGAALLNTIDLLNRSHISLAKLVHLKSSVIIHKPVAVKANAHITTTQKINKIQIRKNAFILGLSGEISIDGHLFRTHQEDFYIRNSKLISESVNLPVHDCSHMIRHIKSRKAQLYLSVTRPPVPVTIKKSMPLNYAHISGDYNLFHATKIGAKLCGQPEAFLQGTGVQSLCWQFLENALKKQVKNFDIIFAKPAYVGKTYALWFDHQSFELVDDHFTLVAFGGYSV